MIECNVSATTAIHVKWFAHDAKNGSAKGASNTSVNKSILSARKKIKDGPEPALTIYPQEYAMPKLRSKYSPAKSILTNSKTASKVEKVSDQTKGPNETKLQVHNSNEFKSFLVQFSSSVSFCFSFVTFFDFSSFCVF